MAGLQVVMATIAGINNLYGFENLIGLTGDRRKAADLLHKSTACFSHRLADGQQLVNAKDGDVRQANRYRRKGGFTGL